MSDEDVVYVFKMADGHVDDDAVDLILKVLGMAYELRTGQPIRGTRGESVTYNENIIPKYMSADDFDELPAPKPRHKLFLVASNAATFDYVHDEAHVNIQVNPGGEASEVLRDIGTELAKHGL